MDSSYIFGISSLILGVLGLWIPTLVKKRISLTLVCHEDYSIFNNFIEKSKSIKIEYDKKPIDKNLQYLRLSIINDGNNDIDKGSVYDPVSIIFPDNFEILESSIIQDPFQTNSKIKINNNVITIDWDLLKTNEYCTFELFLNSKEEDTDLYDEIEFTHRITNLKNIKKLKLNKEKQKPLSIFILKYILGTLGALFIFGLIGFASISSFKSHFNPDYKMEVAYSYSNFSDIKIEPLDENSVIVLSQNHVIDTLSNSNIKNYISINPKISKDGTSIFAGIFLSAFILFLIYGMRSIPTDTKEEIIQYRINRILNN